MICTGVNHSVNRCTTFKAMIIKVSVICFKSKVLSNGEHPLMLRITESKKRVMKSLGISVMTWLPKFYWLIPIYS